MDTEKKIKHCHACYSSGCNGNLANPKGCFFYIVGNCGYEKDNPSVEQQEQQKEEKHHG